MEDESAEERLLNAIFGEDELSQEVDSKSRFELERELSRLEWRKIVQFWIESNHASAQIFYQDPWGQDSTQDLVEAWKTAKTREKEIVAAGNEMTVRRSRLLRRFDPTLTNNYLLGEKLQTNIYNASGVLVVSKKRKVTKTVLRKLAASLESLNVDELTTREPKLAEMIHEFKLVSAEIDRALSEIYGYCGQEDR